MAQVIKTGELQLGDKKSYGVPVLNVFINGNVYTLPITSDLFTKLKLEGLPVTK